jgi:cytochrome c biogenesis protein CcmG/thiol:disulfide interchange protein DsbE
MSGSKSWTPYAATLVVAGVVVLFAWLNRDRLSPVVPGRPAPEFSAYDLQGTPKTLADYRGKVVLLNIWATWCPPCQQEMPSMQRLRDAIPDEDFAILAVSVDAPLGERDVFGGVGGNLEVFAETMGLTFRILHDPSGKIQEIYQTTGVPESFVVDRNGLIKKKIAGPTEWDAPANVELIRRLLDG